MRPFGERHCAIVCFCYLIVGSCFTKTSRAFRPVLLARRSSFEAIVGRTLLIVRSSVATQYTIDEPGMDLQVLEKTVTKHCENLNRYLTEKPIAAHTKEAFLVLKGELEGHDRPVILDR